MRAVVVLPTYNEAENIVAFLRSLRAAVPETDVLVIQELNTARCALNVASPFLGVTVQSTTFQPAARRSV